ncbi:hypothetical protein [Tumebacillus permanentifrigoris]|uniref:Uncharacterized protein n=1 Tax=Tumebacillus permanentifrigoris TaxID=378543 RepID=A0A316D3V2_9BACL|nr:hypothetical protein [Tumebacillus permanentifrigoris]PWK06626.1 hypothetical protein C7459_11949 [Tumebacillus permanentifrigoris]
MKIKCTDCYEENHVSEPKCTRCGRLLDDARKGQTNDHFEWQHHDAPNTIVDRNKRGGSSQEKKNTVW